MDKKKSPKRKLYIFLTLLVIGSLLFTFRGYLFPVQQTATEVAAAATERPVIALATSTGTAVPDQTVTAPKPAASLTATGTVPAAGTPTGTAAAGQTGVQPSATKRTEPLVVFGYDTDGGMMVLDDADNSTVIVLMPYWHARQMATPDEKYIPKKTVLLPSTAKPTERQAAVDDVLRKYQGYETRVFVGTNADGTRDVLKDPGFGFQRKLPAGWYAWPTTDNPELNFHKAYQSKNAKYLPDTTVTGPAWVQYRIRKADKSVWYFQRIVPLGGTFTVTATGGDAIESMQAFEYPMVTDIEAVVITPMWMVAGVDQVGATNNLKLRFPGYDCDGADPSDEANASFCWFDPFRVKKE